MANTDGNAFYAPLLSGTGKFMRKWGTEKNIVEPYITGYPFMNFVYIPKAATMGNIGFSASQIANILSSSVIAVNIPQGNLNKAERFGTGYIKGGVPSYLDLDNTVTIRFAESSGIPVFRIIRNWLNNIRNIYTGVSNLKGEYMMSNYAATAYYWTTKPDGVSPEFYSCLAGMFPTRLPTDSFGHDLTQYDKLDLELEFHVDYIFNEDDWVLEKIKTFTYEPELKDNDPSYVLSK